MLVGPVGHAYYKHAPADPVGRRTLTQARWGERCPGLPEGLARSCNRLKLHTGTPEGVGQFQMWRSDPPSPKPIDLCQLVVLVHVRLHSTVFGFQ